MCSYKRSVYVLVQHSSLLLSAETQTLRRIDLIAASQKHVRRRGEGKEKRKCKCLQRQGGWVELSAVATDISTCISTRRSSILVETERPSSSLIYMQVVSLCFDEFFSETAATENHGKSSLIFLPSQRIVQTLTKQAQKSPKRETVSVHGEVDQVRMCPQ